MTVNELIEQLTAIAKFEGKGDYPVYFDGKWDDENKKTVGVPVCLVLSYAYPGKIRITGN